MSINPRSMIAPSSSTEDAQPRKVQRKRAQEGNDSSEDDGGSRESSMVSPARTTRGSFFESSPAQADNADPELAIIYTPGGLIPDLSNYIGKLIEIRIAAKYITTKNREVARQHIWGTDIYTDDSDAVAMLLHTGSMILRASPPSGFMGVSAVFRILPGRADYRSATRFHFRSHPWGPAYSKCSLQLVRSEKIDQKSTILQARMREAAGEKGVAKKEVKILRMQPVDRSQGSKTPSYRVRRRDIPDASIVYNSSFDPVYKYTLDIMRDTGENPEDWLSTRLKQEVFYFETLPAQGGQAIRYELAREQKQGRYDTYRWSQVLTLPPLRPVLFESKADSKNPAKRRKVEDPSAKPNVPLEEKAVTLLAQGVDWEEIEWGPEFVRVRGTDYPVHCVWFRAINHATS